MEQPNPPVIRRADGPADMEAIYAFLLAHETLRAPVNPPKARTGIAAAIRQGLAFIAERDGVLIGTVGLFRTDWWFSDESAFFSKWFHVAEEFRSPDVVAAIIEELYDLVETEQEPVYIHLFKAGKLPRFASRAAEEYALFPSGRVTAIHPATEG